MLGHQPRSQHWAQCLCQLAVQQWSDHWLIWATVFEAEQESLETDRMAKECYDTLKMRAHWEGPIKQVALIQEALLIYASIAEPVDATVCKISDLIDWAFAIGTTNKDLLKCITLLNCINNKSFESLQTQVSQGLANSTADAPYTFFYICKLFQTVDSLATLTKGLDTVLAVHDQKHAHNSLPTFLAVPSAMWLKPCVIATPRSGASSQVAAWPARQLRSRKQHVRLPKEEARVRNLWIQHPAPMPQRTALQSKVSTARPTS